MAAKNPPAPKAKKTSAKKQASIEQMAEVLSILATGHHGDHLGLWAAAHVMATPAQRATMAAHNQLSFWLHQVVADPAAPMPPTLDWSALTPTVAANLVAMSCSKEALQQSPISWNTITAPKAAVDRGYHKTSFGALAMTTDERFEESWIVNHMLNGTHSGSNWGLFSFMGQNGVLSDALYQQAERCHETWWTTLVQTKAIQATTLVSSALLGDARTIRLYDAALAKGHLASLGHLAPSMIWATPKDAQDTLIAWSSGLTLDILPKKATQKWCLKTLPKVLEQQPDWWSPVRAATVYTRHTEVLLGTRLLWSSVLDSPFNTMEEDPVAMAVIKSCQSATPQQQLQILRPFIVDLLSERQILTSADLHHVQSILALMAPHLSTATAHHLMDGLMKVLENYPDRLPLAAMIIPPSIPFLGAVNTPSWTALLQDLTKKDPHTARHFDLDWWKDVSLTVPRLAAWCEQPEASVRLHDVLSGMCAHAIHVLNNHPKTPEAKSASQLKWSLFAQQLDSPVVALGPTKKM